ncbi:MAG: hypothetical protein IKM19_08085 [Firmicutes bacterium]|nr:hypothetical protein [Bacillota bacterium]
MKGHLRKILITVLVLTLMIPSVGVGLAAEADTSASAGIPLDTAHIAIERGKTYTVSNAEELYNFASIVNDSGQTFEGATVNLIADVMINKGVFTTVSEGTKYSFEYIPAETEAQIESWIPVGNSRTPFQGTFDGNGHVISGFYCSGSYAESGFFGITKGADVRNVVLENGFIYGPTAGSVCGLMQGGSIENCRTSLSVVGKHSSKHVNSVGGIAGKAEAWDDSYSGGVRAATINSCINTGIVYGAHNAAICGTISISTVVKDCADFGTIGGSTGTYKLVGTDLADYGSTRCDDSIYMNTDRQGNIIDGCIVMFNAEETLKRGVECRAEEGYILVEKTARVALNIVPKEGYKIYYVNENDSPAVKFGENLYWVGSGNLLKICCVEEDKPFESHIYNSQYGDVEYETDNVLMFRPHEGAYIQDIVVNGVSQGSITQWRIQENDDIEIYFAKEGLTWEETELRHNSEKLYGKLIKGVENTTVKLTTKRLSGGKIRVKWTKSKGYKVDYYEIFRSTKKSDVIAGKPVYMTKKSTSTSWTSSKGLKKGTKYYYKVRGVRVMGGVKYYTQWSNYGVRTA